MPRRQDFNDFLNSPGPSTPRGRGRGRGGNRGGGGSNRGGSGGYGQSRSTFSTDYSNVPLDYNNLNTRKYTKLSEYSETSNPYGPNAESPSSFSTPGRGRGRGRGGRGGGGGGHEGGRHRPSDSTPDTPNQNSTPGSGSRTPVPGLGFHGQGHAFPPSSQRSERSGIGRGGRGSRGGLGAGGGRGGGRFSSGATVGKEGVRWGGGAAPIFVKAGELFKDDEKVMQLEEEAKEDAGVEVMNDTSEGVIEPLPPISSWTPPRKGIVEQKEGVPDQGRSTDEEDEEAIVEDDDEDDEAEEDDDDVDEEDNDEAEEDEQSVEHDKAPDALVETTTVTQSDQELVIKMEETAITEQVALVVEPARPLDGIDDTQNEEISIDEPEDDEEPLFYVDTEPNTATETNSIAYDTKVGTALGTTPPRASSPEQEEIIFRPRHYPQPQPIALDMATAESSSSRLPEASKSPELSAPADTPDDQVEPTPQTTVAASSLNRRQKKALKREKRTRNKSKSKGKSKASGKKPPTRRPKAYEGSDLDWGSDGPPSHMIDMEMLGDSESDEELDAAILKDYLAGTKLGHEGDLREMEEEADEEEVDSDLDLELELDSDEDEGDGEDGEGVVQEGVDVAVLGGDVEFELESDEEDNPDLETSDEEDEDDDDNDEEEEEEVDEDEEDDGDSSELGEIQFHLNAAALGGDSDDEDENVDDEDMFNAKDSWNDTEWFIKNMEQALDGDVDMGDRKARKALFRTIEDGDFGDDWGLAPAKKKKNKSGIPLELQGQWEKDRQRKADRKRQRDLERLAAILDPYPATHGKKQKGKGKGMSRIEQVKLAHLIPESATRVAEMFDIPSDVDESPLPPSLMGRQANLLPGGRGFPALDAGIRVFIMDQGKTTYSVPPMDKEGRKKVHMLAECYGLTSKSRGKGKARFTVLTKTSRTGQNINEDKITRLVSAATFSGGAFYKALHTKPSNKKDKSRVKGTGPAGDRGSSAKMRDGETVGEGAERIGMENIGHRLLSRMGWSEGDRIGKSDGGLDNPIMAIVKNTKMGLGA